MEMNSQVSVLSGREQCITEMRNLAETPRNDTTAEGADIEHAMKASCYCDSANCSKIDMESPSDTSLVGVWMSNRIQTALRSCGKKKTYYSIDFSLRF